MITDEQVMFVYEQMELSTLKYQELKDDLVDHFCCLIEIEMKKGVGFEQAYSDAYRQTTPNGFDEIQQEAYYMLNKNKITKMRQLTYASGFVFSLSTTFGALFKVLHLQGAGLLLFGGMMGLAFIFAPLYFMQYFRANEGLSSVNRFRMIFGYVSLLNVAFGVFMKLSHMQGASMILVIGTVLTGLVFLPIHFFHMYKQSMNRI